MPGQVWSLVVAAQCIVFEAKIPVSCVLVQVTGRALQLRLLGLALIPVDAAI